MADAHYRKKLIEVAIPLDAINKESAREKSIRHGHPSTLHLWWARRPLAACRAVIFCSLIDDPGEEGVPPELLRQIDALPEPLPLPADWGDLDPAEQRRARLFKFIETLVKWESTTDDEIINTARNLILAATDNNPPPLLDPFCGGGSIPLEAQRLGLEAHGSDLNPVAVLITKALIELPPKFAGMPPVNPDARAELGSDAQWKGAAGLAEDVRWYGEWMRQQAWERIGHLYPEGPNGETVIAWLWARTVKCPNPACGIEMPLTHSFWLSKKRSNAWVEPTVTGDSVQFCVRDTDKPEIDGTISRNGAICTKCHAAVPFQHIRDQGQRSQLGTQLMAVIEEGHRRRVYRSATAQDERSAWVTPPDNVPEQRLPDEALGFRVQNYGFKAWSELFTPRQLVVLTTLSDLVGEARELVRQHAGNTSISDDSYADAVATYLAFVVDRCVDYGSTLVTWQSVGDFVAHALRRQAISMSWDFAETNFFSNSTGNWRGAVNWVSKVVECLTPATAGAARQIDAASTFGAPTGTVVVTDPPYYDNIGYADLADFFYVWLRRSLHAIYPEELATVLTPKSPEMIAAPHRFDGDKQAAERYFETGLNRTFELINNRVSASAPTTLFYAYKQKEQREADNSAISTGWETMLTGLIDSGFAVTGTWPMRTEMGARLRARASNALATSVVIVCRPRPDDAPMADIGEFNRALATELPTALNRFIGEHIAPVDLPQASIGPGMAVFSKYSAVVLPNGERMTVRRALELINKGVEEFFSEREGTFDEATQFCLRWFEQFGFEEGAFGDAAAMALAKNITVDSLASIGVLTARRGRVRLLPFERYESTWESWDPAAEHPLSAWRSCHYLAAALEHGGIAGTEHDAGGAASLARDLGSVGERARELAYRLYAICDAKGWSQEAQRYNALADSWPAISLKAGELRVAQQATLAEQ